MIAISVINEERCNKGCYALDDMSKYKIKLDDLSEKNMYIDKMLRQVNECVTNIEKSLENINWEGLAKSNFFKKLEDYKTELKKVNEGLESFLKYTQKYHENYSEGYSEIKKEFSEVKKDMGIRWKENM